MKRTVLVLMLTAFAAGAVWLAWPLISPVADRPGAHVKIVWQGQPVFVHRKSASEIERAARAPQSR